MVSHAVADSAKRRAHHRHGAVDLVEITLDGGDIHLGLGEFAAVDELRCATSGHLLQMCDMPRKIYGVVALSRLWDEWGAAGEHEAKQEKRQHRRCGWSPLHQQPHTRDTRERARHSAKLCERVQ